VRRLFWFVVVIALLLALDSAARSYVGNQIEGRLARVLEADERPKVVIGGFPFLASAIDGEFESISISADRPGWESGSIELSDVNLTLHEVELSLAQALRGELANVEVESARGTAHIDADVLSAALRRLNSSGAQIPLPEGELSTEGNTLRLGPVTLPLPTPIEGMSFESAEVIDGSVALEFALDRTTFPTG
jgi:hypothetical protein